MLERSIPRECEVSRRVTMSRYALRQSSQVQIDLPHQDRQSCFATSTAEHLSGRTAREGGHISCAEATQNVRRLLSRVPLCLAVRPASEYQQLQLAARDGYRPRDTSPLEACEPHIIDTRANTSITSSDPRTLKGYSKSTTLPLPPGNLLKTIDNSLWLFIQHMREKKKKAERLPLEQWMVDNDPPSEELADLTMRSDQMKSESR